jgi:hypothetical protein
MEAAAAAGGDERKERGIESSSRARVAGWEAGSGIFWTAG